MHLVVVPCTYFHETSDMTLAFHGDHFLSESKPQHQDMLDEGLARYFDVKCLRRVGPGFRVKWRFLKTYVSWSAERFVWHGDPAKVDQLGQHSGGNCQMSTLGCSWNQSLGHGRRDAD